MKFFVEDLYRFFARQFQLPRPALARLERRWLRQIGPYAQRSVRSTDPFSHGPIFLCPSRRGLLEHKNRVSPSFMSLTGPHYLAETI